MFDSQDIGMKCLSAKGFQRVLGRRRELIRLGLEARAIDRIAEERMADGSEMDPQLMRASRLQAACEQARNRLPVDAAIAFEHLPMADRGATVCTHGHAIAHMGMAPDRLLDGAAGALRPSPDESKVAAAQRPGTAVVGELPAQRAVGAVGLGHDQETARVLVEAVHDAGAFLAANAGEGWAAMSNQRIDQRARPVAGGGMDDEPGGLVDDEELVVLVHDVQRDILRRDFGVRRGRNGEANAVAGVDAIAGIADGGAVVRNRPRQDQRLVARARELREVRCQDAIEPCPAFLGGNRHFLAALRHGHPMSDPSADGDQPLDPAAARIVAKVRWLMLIAGATTLLAVSAVIGVIGYRLFTSGERAGALVEATALVATGVAEDRIAVTLDVGGATEIRTFDLKTLRPTGRLRFTTEP